MERPLEIWMFFSGYQPKNITLIETKSGKLIIK